MIMYLFWPFPSFFVQTWIIFLFQSLTQVQPFLDGLQPLVIVKFPSLDLTYVKKEHLDVIFLLSSACLLPITEICRGPSWLVHWLSREQTGECIGKCMSRLDKLKAKGEKERAKTKNREVIMVPVQQWLTVICFSEVICCSIIGSLLKGT